MKTVAEKTLWTLRYALGWLPFFALYAVAMHADDRGSWAKAIGYTAFYFVPGFLLGIGGWWFVGRVAERRFHWGKFFAIHLAAGLVFAFAWHIIFFSTLALVSGASVLKQFQSSRVMWMMLIGLLVYGVVGGMRSVQRLVEQVRERELNAAKAESLRVRAQMDALRGQLDPHFLFNTLHSITALVRENSILAEEALLQFSDLLRHVIATKRDGNDELPLRDELTFVDRYLALEKLRLSERLKVERDYAPEALDFWIPTFTVQPLVENAIKHAISPHREGGTVKISARVVGQRLKIVVEDNGPGAAEPPPDTTGGVGLAAIRQRLKLRHQNAAAMKIETAPGRGFRVILELPAVQTAIVESVA
ncbi:MAG: histidine kinase [Nibricoccus sp.]